MLLFPGQNDDELYNAIVTYLKQLHLELAEETSSISWAIEMLKNRGRSSAHLDMLLVYIGVARESLERFNAEIEPKPPKLILVR